MKNIKRFLHSAFRGFQILLVAYVALLIALFVLSHHKSLTTDDASNVLAPLTQGDNIWLTPLYIAATYTAYVYLMSFAMTLGHFGFVTLYRIMPPVLFVIAIGIVGWGFAELFSTIATRLTWSGIVVIAVLVLTIFSILLCIGMALMGAAQHPKRPSLPDWVLAREYMNL